MTIPATPRPWIVTFDVPTAVIPGHIIYDGKAPHTPIASLWVGGGTSGKPRQRANAALIVEAVNAYDQLREENARLTQARDIRTAHFDEVARLRAEHAEMRALLTRIREGIMAQRDNIPSPGKYILPINALLAKMEAAT